jgi:DNA-binding MarR family transcriptional regulator
MGNRPTDADYAHLLELRTGLRRFQRWSDEQAVAAGLTAAQHQLLLAVRGHPDPRGPTISDVAESLLLRHHSAVGLVDRAGAAGLVRRKPDPEQRSVVRLELTRDAARKLERLAARHLDELSHLAPTMEALWHQLEATAQREGRPHPARRRRRRIKLAPESG